MITIVGFPHTVGQGGQKVSVFKISQSTYLRRSIDKEFYIVVKTAGNFTSNTAIPHVDGNWVRPVFAFPRGTRVAPLFPGPLQSHIENRQINY